MRFYSLSDLKILIYALNYKPENVGTGKYTGELVDFLLERKVEIRIITTNPYYPSWVCKKNSYKYEDYEKLKIYRCPLWVPKNPIAISRVLHLLTFALSSLPIFLKLLFWKPNGIITIAPAIFCAQIVCFAKFIFRKRIKTWLHIQDFEIDAAFDLNLIKNNFLKKITLFWERELLNNFDNVSTISPDMISKLKSKRIRPEKIFYMPNWIDLKEIFPIEAIDDNFYRRKYNISNEKIVILYSGSMNKKQGLNKILKVIEFFKEHKKIFWILAGDGPEKNQIIYKTKNIKNIIILPLQERKYFNALLNCANIHLLPQKEGIETNALPSKFIGMIASGKPIITCASKNTYLGEISSKVGIRVDPQKESEIIQAINNLTSDETKRIEFGKKAREESYYFDKKKILDAFFKKIQIVFS